MTMIFIPIKKFVVEFIINKNLAIKMNLQLDIGLCLIKMALKTQVKLFLNSTVSIYKLYQRQ